METYHKIQTLFKRHQDGKNKGKMIRGAWTTPELEYLAKNEWEFTEKVDGTNIRVSYDPFLHPDDHVRFGGRTDRAQIPEGVLEYLTHHFSASALADVLHGDGMPPRVVLFGEGYGPKVQDGGKYRDDHSFVLFDVKIGDWWLLRKDVDDIAKKLGIDSVPVVGHGTLHDAIDIVSTGITFTDTGSVKRWGRKGLDSKWGAFEAEGIVARPVVPMFDRKGQRIITKIKAVDFR